MNRSARSVATGIGKVQSFHHNALAGEGCVAVHHDAQDGMFGGLCPAAAILPSTDASDNHRIDDFQM